MRSPRGMLYCYSTGAIGANKDGFGQWTTLDMPVTEFSDRTYGERVYGYTPSPLGPTITYGETPHFLPLPKYQQEGRAYKYMPFNWKSKKFVMPGRTTFSVMKVVYKGCVKVKIWADGCCVYQTMLTTCMPFRLPDEVVGTVFEIEFTGKGYAEVTECEIASSLEELAHSGQDGEH